VEDEDEEEDFEWVDERSKLKIWLSKFLGHEDGTAHDVNVIHKESIMMNNWQYVVRIYPTVAWSVVVMVLMLLFTARYYTAIEPEGQRLVVMNLMLQAEVRVSASLAPAFRAVSSLALAARAGVMNASEPYSSVSNILAPEINAGPSINYIAVVGAGDRMALLRPGDIHDENRPTTERYPLVFASPTPCASWKKDPMRCLDLNNSALIDVPRDAAAMRWQRPSFLTYDGSVPVWIKADERMDPLIDPTKLTLFVHRLAAYINATNATLPGGVKGPNLAIEVAIDLAETAEALRGEVVPKDGATYVCTTDGTVIAGSNWLPQADALYDPEEGMMIYPRMWDLGLPWMEAVSPEMIAGNRQSEGWSGSDFVVARPLAVGDLSGASYRTGLADLRIVSTAPRSVGASDDFKALVHGAMGVMGAPGVFVLLALVVLSVHAAFMAGARWLFEHWH